MVFDYLWTKLKRLTISLMYWQLLVYIFRVEWLKVANFSKVENTPFFATRYELVYNEPKVGV